MFKPEIPVRPDSSAQERLLAYTGRNPSLGSLSTLPLGVATSELVATDYDGISDEYQRSRQAPWRTFVEAPSFLNLVGDVTDRSVLDLACGEGYYTRQLAAAGAIRVVGVDSSPAMIRLAEQAGGDGDASLLGRIDYHVGDAAGLDLEERFDLVTAAYLLDYAAEGGGQLALCRAVARHLVPGGRFVGITINPQIDDPELDYRAYGSNASSPTGCKTERPSRFATTRTRPHST